MLLADIVTVCVVFRLSCKYFECCFGYFRVMLQIRFVAEKTPECRLTVFWSDFCVDSVIFRLSCKYF